LSFTNALRIGHYGFSVFVLTTSFIIPVLFSVLFWNEPLGIVKLTGIIFIFIAFFFIAFSGTSLEDKERKIWRKWFVFIVCAFFLNGIPQISQAAVTGMQGGNYLSFLFITYLSGGIALSCLSFKKHAITTGTILFSLGATIGSILGCFFTLKSLELLSETVVFPVSLSSTIIVGVLLSRFLFRERINKRGYFGIISAITGIIILCFSN